MTVVPSSVVVLRDWMLSNANISALVDQRVSSVLPIKDLVFPWVTLQRIVGVSQVPEASMDTARIQINVWGGTKQNGLPNFEDADLVARTIAAEVRIFRGEELGDAYLADLDELEGMQQLVDPDTGDARFWLDVIAVIRRTDGQ